MQPQTAILRDESCDRAERLRHDLRTPLAVIVGFADLLAADRALDPETRRDYARRIATAASALRAALDADARS